MNKLKKKHQGELEAAERKHKGELKEAELKRKTNNRRNNLQCIRELEKAKKICQQIKQREEMKDKQIVKLADEIKSKSNQLNKVKARQLQLETDLDYADSCIQWWNANYLSSRLSTIPSFKKINPTL